MATDVFCDVTSLLCTFLIALIIATIIFKWYRERNYLPGPAGLPVVGYALFLGKKPHETLGGLSRKYGDVFSFYAGPTLCICVNDYFMAKELLNNPKLLYRSEDFSSFLSGKGGMAGMNGAEWQEQRRFTFYTMRNLGLGKGLWETMIQEATVEFTEDMKRLKGQPKNIEDILGSFHTSNIISLLLGRHLNKDKGADEIRVILESTKAFTKYLAQASLCAVFPRLRKVLEVFRLAGYHKFLQHLREFEDIFKRDIEERVNGSKSVEREDYIGCFFKEMEEREKGTENHTFTMETLLGNLVVLFISSHDTTKASISWLLLYMAAYPDVQEKVRDEIDNAVSRDSAIYFDDKTKLPYTMATIFEMWRHASIAPITPPRTVTEDMMINGCFVPKNSFFLVNLWAIMHDPRYFNEPMEFQPERFLTENGKVVKNVEGFIPFSFGKRNCPGEGIAIMTIFLYFASFIQKFKITMPPGKKANLESVMGTGNLPEPQEICFLER